MSNPDRKKSALSKDKIYLISPYGLGDTMILCGLREHIEKKYDAEVVYVIKPSHTVVMKLYGYHNYEVCTYEKPELFDIGSQRSNPQQGELYVAHPEFSKDQKAINKFMCGDISFVEMYQQFMGLGECELKFPTEYGTLSSADYTFDDISKAILLSPDNHAADNRDHVPEEFFVRHLEHIGSGNDTPDLIVNDMDKRYPVLYGKHEELTIEQVLYIGMNCKKVVASRSGICDLLFPKVREMEIIYPNRHFWEMYGMKRTYGCELENIKEIIL